VVLALQVRLIPRRDDLWGVVLTLAQVGLSDDDEGNEEKYRYLDDDK
jgi:hypothetical protein